MSETFFEVPVNPTDGNHSTDDKTSKSADNNQPSPYKEDRAETPTNTGLPIRRSLS
ncbi:Levansucrase [Streptococcus thermophilus]|uniref:Levansucrase n=1 Tax=Streptococcus thermophilus TaxID=1308 RepID=A0A8D6XSY8_STRTR|nr:levansucrase [Streptococcus thermophilus]CAD0148390.1 Levansucrase [Streptococcus thermophilus]CAD0149304.1 Levansucrase [Streptococcus thermophilus]CAD0151217.1 Levansucrase [Streptococcus thermophilus]